MNPKPFKIILLKEFIYSFLIICLFNVLLFLIYGYLFHLSLNINNLKNIFLFFFNFIIMMAIEIVIMIFFIRYRVNKLNNILHLPYLNIIKNIQEFKNDLNYEVNEIPESMVQELNVISYEYSELEKALKGTTERNKQINYELNNSRKEIEKAYSYFTGKLIELVEGYDENTGNHVERVGLLSEFIARRMGMSEEFCQALRKYAPLHDLGKIIIPQSILLKEGELNKEEYSIMKNHTIIGGRLLSGSELFSIARNIALYHHEKYDGSGYPSGLKYDEIPIEAAIVSIVDVYDALRSVRPYKKEYTHKQALEILINGDSRISKNAFNPFILEIFLKNENDIEFLWLSSSKIIK